MIIWPEEFRKKDRGDKVILPYGFAHTGLLLRISRRTRDAPRSFHWAGWCGGGCSWGYVQFVFVFSKIIRTIP